LPFPAVAVAVAVAAAVAVAVAVAAAVAVTVTVTVTATKRVLNVVIGKMNHSETKRSSFLFRSCSFVSGYTKTLKPELGMC
jgi:hypothetical protein